MAPETSIVAVMARMAQVEVVDEAGAIAVLFSNHSK